MQKAVEAAFARIVADGAIEKAIEKQLQETISNIVSSHLREYGDFGKALKDQLGKALHVDLSRTDLPGYGDFILKIVRGQVDNHLMGEAAKKIEANLAALLADPPAEITIDKLVEDFKEHVKRRNYGGELDHEITLHVECTDYGFWHIAMDKDSGEGQYQCEVRIGVDKDGSIYQLVLGEENMDKKLFIREPSGFERDMYRAFVGGTRIVIPEGAAAYDFDKSLRDYD